MAVYVTDTHPLLWYATNTHAKLSRDCLRAFQRASRSEALIWIPALALWEAGILERMGRIRFPMSFQSWVDELLGHPGFALAPFDDDVLHAALNIQLNIDAFDLSIVATARAKNLPLLTKDTQIAESGLVDTVW